MGSKYVKDKGYLVWFSKKNPATGMSYSLRRWVKQKSHVKRMEQELIAAVERGIAEKITPKWRDVVTGYVEDARIRGLAEVTIYNTQKCVEAATFEKWGSRLVTEITTQDIRNLIQVDFKDNAPSHQRAMLKYLRQVFTYALENGHLQRDPVPKLAFRVGDKIKKVLTEEQVKYLLTAAKAMNWEWYPHVTMCLYTGLRNGELYALTWDRVDLESRKIIIDRAWCSKGGFKSTKSGDDRVIEIAANLVPLLKDLKLKSYGESFVLPHMREWEIGEQARQLRRFLVGIGLPEIRFHDLRATWATLLLSKGVAPAKVMMMGGWKDMKTMMIYMRKTGIDIKGMTDCLNLHDPNFSGSKILNFSSPS